MDRRSRGEAAAALMNCGRLPITVRTFKARSGSACLPPPRFSRSPAPPPRTSSSRPTRPAGPHGSSRQGTPRPPPIAPPACRSRSDAPDTSITTALVIEARMWSSSGGVSTSPSLTQKIELVGASSTRPCGVTSSASSAPRFDRQPGGEHVGRVGERLDAVEDPGRRIGDARQADPLRCLLERLGEQQPPAAAGDSDSQLLVVGSGACLSQQPVGVGAHRLGVDRQSQVRGRPFQPLQMLLQREWPSVVDPDDLKHPVAPQQAAVGGRNLRIGSGHDGAIERGERICTGRGHDRGEPTDRRRSGALGEPRSIARSAARPLLWDAVGRSAGS